MQMAEQPTVDNKHSFHLLHAEISKVNTKGKKINHIIKVYTMYTNTAY